MNFLKDTIKKIMANSNNVILKELVMESDYAIDVMIDENMYDWIKYVKLNKKMNQKLDTYIKKTIDSGHLSFYAYNISILKYLESFQNKIEFYIAIRAILFAVDRKLLLNLYSEDKNYFIDAIYRYYLHTKEAKCPIRTQVETFFNIAVVITSTTYKKDRKILKDLYEELLNKLSIDEIVLVFLKIGDFNYDSSPRENEYKIKKILPFIANILSQKIRSNTNYTYTLQNNRILDLHNFIKYFDDDVAFKLLSSYEWLIDSHYFSYTEGLSMYVDRPKVFRMLLKNIIKIERADNEFDVHYSRPRIYDNYLRKLHGKVTPEIASIIGEHCFLFNKNVDRVFGVLGPLTNKTVSVYSAFLSASNVNSFYLDCFAKYSYNINPLFLDVLSETLIDNSPNFDMTQVSRVFSSLAKEHSNIDNLIIRFIEKYKTIPVILTSKFGIDYVKKYSFSTTTPKYYLENYEYFTDYFETNNEVSKLLYENICMVLRNRDKVDFNLLLYLYNESSFSDELYPLILDENVVVKMDYYSICSFNVLVKLPALEKFLISSYIPAINSDFINEGRFINFGKFLNEDITTALVNRLQVLAMEDESLEFPTSVFELLDPILSSKINKAETTNKIYAFLCSIFNRINLDNKNIILKYCSDNLADLFIKEKILINTPILDLIRDIDFLNKIVMNPSYNKIIVKQILGIKCHLTENMLWSSLLYKLLNKVTLNDKNIRVAIISLINDNNLSLQINELKEILSSTKRTDGFYDEKFLMALSLADNTFYDNLITIYENHPEIKIKSEFIVNKILEYYANENNIPFTNIHLLTESFGLEIVRVLRNKDFLYLVNSKQYIIERLLEIFKVRTLSVRNIEYINYSLNQGIFAINNNQIFSIYSDIMVLIQNNFNSENINYILDLLTYSIPNNLEENIKDLKEEYLLTLYKNNKREFLRELITLIKSYPNKYSAILNKITNNYIVIERNKYAKMRINNDIYCNVNIKKIYDIDSIKENLFFYLLNSKPTQLRELFRKFSMENKIPYENIERALNFLSCKNRNKFPSSELKQIKSCIIETKKFFYDMCEKLKLFDKYSYVLSDSRFLSKVRFTPIMPVRTVPLIDIFSIINIQSLIRNTLKDDVEYESLLKVLDKYKFLDWADTFAPHIYALRMNIHERDMYYFIGAYHDIYSHRAYNKQAIISPLTLLKFISVFGNINIDYNHILGEETASIIKLDAGPNSANILSKKRLETAAELYIKMLSLNEVTIPSFVDEYTISKHKKIRVIVGNKTNPINLTHGERTGSCMRIGGVGSSLFEFCLLDMRGFHIVFIDSETDKYITRISGFRNGNTVFLNQLRNSLQEYKFSSNDIIYIMKLVARKIIEKSMDSTMPIDNIVSSPTYTLRDENTVVLSDINIGEGVYTGYKDIGHEVVLLATTNKDKSKPAKIILNSNQPIYESVRYPVKIYEETEISDSLYKEIQRIHTIKTILDKKDISNFYRTANVDVEINDFKYVILAENFYVAVNRNNEIVSELAKIDGSVLEYQSALNLASDHVKKISKRLQ